MAGAGPGRADGAALSRFRTRGPCGSRAGLGVGEDFVGLGGIPQMLARGDIGEAVRGGAQFLRLHAPAPDLLRAVARSRSSAIKS